VAQSVPNAIHFSLAGSGWSILLDGWKNSRGSMGETTLATKYVSRTDVRYV